MRAAYIFTTLMLVSCAHEPLAVAPPAGVDFSGHWRLDAADSDDPHHLVQSDALGPDSGRGPEGRSATWSVGAIGDAMQWPGKDLVIKQIGGVVAFSSDGENRVYQPSSSFARRARSGRRRRSEQRCGWSGKSLLVEATPDDDGPAIEERYQISADGGRLLQKIRPSGAARGEEFVRVWDRVR